MRSTLVYRLALLFMRARQTIALPAGAEEAWQFNHPILDPPPESLMGNYEDDPPYVPLYPHGLPNEPVSDDHQATAEWRGGASSSNLFRDTQDAYDQLEQQMPRLQVDIVSDDEEDGSYTQTDHPVVDRKPKRIFVKMALAMGTEMHERSLYKRYKEHSTPNLALDLVSNSDEKRRRATRTILLQRIPQKSRYGPNTTASLPSWPIYQGHTKEDILLRLYQIMDVEPMEDIKHLWYDRICNEAQGDNLSRLYSSNRKDQVAAIKDLLGLIPLNDLWVREKKGTGRPSYVLGSANPNRSGQ